MGCKCLGAVVDDDCASEIAAENAQVFDVVAVHVAAVVPEQTVPESVRRQSWLWHAATLY